MSTDGYTRQTRRSTSDTDTECFTLEATVNLGQPTDTMAINGSNTCDQHHSGPSGMPVTAVRVRSITSPTLTVIWRRASNTGRASQGVEEQHPKGEPTPMPTTHAPDQRRHLLDIAEVAELLGVQVRHVRRLVHERRIPYIKWGHLIRFDPTEVELWIASHSREAAH